MTASLTRSGINGNPRDFLEGAVYIETASLTRSGINGNLDQEIIAVQAAITTASLTRSGINGNEINLVCSATRGFGPLP